MTLLIPTYLILVIFLTIYFKKKKFLSNYSGNKHQIFLNKKNIPLLGGIFLIIPIVHLNVEYSIFIYAIILIFMIGLLSDLEILSSPKKRFLIQFAIIIVFVFLNDFKIQSSRLIYFDLILEYVYFSYFFSCFCILILLNGSNFIDGINGLCLGYLALIIYFLFNLNLLNQFNFEIEKIYFLALVIFILLILNFNNKLMLGDTGAYITGFFMAFLIIQSHNFNPQISPYFYINLVWYPCFENLFSIIRKFRLKVSPIKPDNKHLHQLLFLKVKRNFKLNDLLSNNFSSLIIILCNFFIMFFSSLDPFNTKFQITMNFISIIFYVIFYNFLKNSKMLNQLKK